MEFKYEEAHFDGAKQVLNRKQRVVADLHAMRAQRRQRGRHSSDNDTENVGGTQQQQQQQHSYYQSPSQAVDEGCILM